MSAKEIKKYDDLKSKLFDLAKSILEQTLQLRAAGAEKAYKIYTTWYSNNKLTCLFDLEQKKELTKIVFKIKKKIKLDDDMFNSQIQKMIKMQKSFKEGRAKKPLLETSAGSMMMLKKTVLSKALFKLLGPAFAIQNQLELEKNLKKQKMYKKFKRMSQTARVTYRALKFLNDITFIGPDELARGLAFLSKKLSKAPIENMEENPFAALLYLIRAINKKTNNSYNEKSFLKTIAAVDQFVKNGFTFGSPATPTIGKVKLGSCASFKDNFGSFIADGERMLSEGEQIYRSLLSYYILEENNTAKLYDKLVKNFIKPLANMLKVVKKVGKKLK